MGFRAEGLFFCEGAANISSTLLANSFDTPSRSEIFILEQPHERPTRAVGKFPKGFIMQSRSASVKFKAAV